VREVDHDIASPAEAREILGLRKWETQWP
jgi:hypothetical protein